MHKIGCQRTCLTGRDLVRVASFWFCVTFVDRVLFLSGYLSTKLHETKRNHTKQHELDHDR